MKNQILEAVLGIILVAVSFLMLYVFLLITHN
jgi:hypothetical protein